MSKAFYRDTVDVLRPAVKNDRTGTPRLDYSGLEEAEGVARGRVHVRPVSSTESTDDDGITVVNAWDIATAPRSARWDVRSGDWVRLPDGTIVAVDGEPLHPTLYGRHHHTRLRARLAKGTS